MGPFGLIELEDKEQGKYFGLIRFKQTKPIWTIREISQTASSESIKNPEYQRKPWKIFVYYFFATFLDISTTESVCCCTFKANTFFFHLLKNCKQFGSLILTVTTQSSQTILSCPR